MKLIAVFSVFFLVASAANLRSPVKAIKDILPESRIVGGNVAAVGQFPYTVFLIAFDGTNSWSCGGSIISNDYVLTAGHCTFQATNITILAGTSRLMPVDVSVQERTAVQVILHEGYNPYTLLNDISLIKLSSPLAFNFYVNKVPLITPEEAQTNLEGHIAVASGWGKTADDEGGSNNLLFVYLYIANQSKCEQGYVPGAITAGNICVETQGGTTSTCNGDSGGPMVLNSGRQAGLTSFGPLNGCQSGVPVVFTRISHYLGWINSNTGL